jgi:hypothetical protein
VSFEEEDEARAAKAAAAEGKKAKAEEEEEELYCIVCKKKFRNQNQVGALSSRLALIMGFDRIQ